MDAAKYKIQSLEVCKTRGGILDVSSHDLDMLKQRAKASKLHRSRICCHASNDDPVHEMIIAMTKDVKIPTHRHIDKEESFHVIEGRLRVVLFDEMGRITRNVDLCEYRLGGSFYYRLPKNVFHTVLVKSEIALVHEVTNGPFVEGQAETADFIIQELENSF